MMRVRCPKCESFITFDDTKYQENSTLIFTCPYCGKQFGIRLKTSKDLQKQEGKKSGDGDMTSNKDLGSIIVMENDYCYKQVLPLHIGDNTIGRYMKGNNINMPIETGDLTMDLLHCVINVSVDKRGNIKYILRDGPSNHGTFLNGIRINPKEKIIIENGAIFNIGVTTLMLNTEKD